jgi:23S rRNA (adenine2503-C2)-methyltransferase
LAQKLVSDIRFPEYAIRRTQEHEVIKFATGFADSVMIESVIIPARNRITLCVSSQAGCKMNCAFCATGAQGFVRNLTVQEIVVQVWIAVFTFGYAIDNIVFMGMGEPLDNIDNVVQAIRIITEQQGLAIAQRNITISTAGHADGIADLATRSLPLIRLAVSLNAPDDALRSKLMPINKKYPLEELKKQLADFPLGKKGVYLIEYVLLAGINDSYEMAQLLADYVSNLPVRINLIAYNENKTSTFAASRPEQVQRFALWLKQRKLFVVIRKSPGQGISAACGQLSAENV